VSHEEDFPRSIYRGWPLRIVGKEQSPASLVRHLVIYAVGMSACVGLALFLLFSLLDEAVEMPMCRNCLKAYPNRPLRCIAAERALQLDYYVP
jgi:hypothetical protein